MHQGDIVDNGGGVHFTLQREMMRNNVEKDGDDVTV